jgi:hypothetical protein
MLTKPMRKHDQTSLKTKMAAASTKNADAGPKPKRKRIPIKLKTKPPDTVENFESLLPKKERCRFDLFVAKNNGEPPFVNGKMEWCHRGDKYSPEDFKMLKFLLGIVKNHHATHRLMELYDHTKSTTNGERLILKIFKNEVKVNRLTDYAHLLNNFHLPEWLSVEVK